LLPFPRVGFQTERVVLEFELPAGMRAGSDGKVHVPGPGEFCGAILAATGEDSPPRVTTIVPGSPAARAGLRKGDRVASIGGEIFASQDLPVFVRGLWLQRGVDQGVNVLGADGKPRLVVLRAQ
jgi:C-terminal processing protease CtpA/Prc